MEVQRFALVLMMAASLGGCGYQKRAEEVRAAEEAVRQAEKDISERGEALSTWADELEAQEANLKQREQAVIDRLAEIQREKVAIEKLKVELEKRHKEAMRGTAPSIAGRHAVVIDAETGITLFEKNADERTAVASTQKLMTGLLVAECGDLEGEVTVEDADTRVEPTKFYIKPGENYLRKDLLRGLLVRSGNDLALCLARDNAGSKEAFAEKMNQRAKELGMTNSNFVNPHGLTEKGQHSTARDMAKLAMAVYANPVLREIVQTEKTTFEMADGTSKLLVNTNRVLRDFDLCDGMKTGFTVASGYCLVCSGCRDDIKRIVVVLGSDGRSVWSDSRKLLEWALKA